MELRARDRVPALTGLLTVVSLALVFGAVGGVIPQSLLPRAPDSVLAVIPHVNAAISATAIVTILSGVTFARRREFTRHRYAMVTSLVLFATFLVLYLYRLTLVGTTAFPGPEGVYTTVYLPVLAIHILLAIVCIPLLYYVALLALTRPLSDVFGTKHKRVGRVSATLWLVSFALGIVVYLLLYVVY
jgi:putative membrane protein